MYTRNTLLCICSYLDFQSLARLSQVNHLCHSAAEQDELWHLEAVRVCATSIDFFQVLQGTGSLLLREVTNTKPWKSIVSGVVKTTTLWSRLSVPADIDFKWIGEYVMNALQYPEPPAPRLCREGSSLETTAQELFAQSLKDSPSESTEVSAMLMQLEPHFPALLQEVAGHVEEELLLKARWVLRNSPGDFRYSRSVIIRIYYCLKKSIQAHCKSVRAFLEDCETLESLLIRYCSEWSAFAATARQLEADFAPVVNLLNRMYEEKTGESASVPCFSMVKFMTILWRRRVFDWAQKDLMRAASLCLSQMHTNTHSADQLQALSQSLVDLSIDEYTVQLLQHSQVQLDGPYNDFHALVVDHAAQTLAAVSEAEECAELAEKALRAAERLYLPVTVRQLGALFASAELALLQRKVAALAPTCASGSSSPVEETAALNSAFGEFLFSLPCFQHSRVRVSRFLTALVADSPQYQATADRYNDLAETAADSDKTAEDEWVERRAKRLMRVPLAVPAKLRTTAHDLKRKELPDLQDCSA